MNIEDVVLQRERARCAALVAADIETLADFLSDELLFCHSSGKHDTKQSLLEKLSSGQIRYLSASSTEEKVQLLPGGALLHAKFKAQVQVNGRSIAIYNQALSVWIEEQCTWRQIAYQPTPLAPAS